MEIKSELDISNWVHAYGDDLYAWAYYKLGDKELAEDIVQDTFLAAHQAIGKFNSESSPKTWLTAILKNKVADHYRKSFKQPTVSFDDDAHPFFKSNGRWEKEQMKSLAEYPFHQELLDDDDFNHTLEDCMQKLPNVWHSAINFKYISEKNSADICQELNITPTNYWQLIHRAKLHLRDCLKNNWFN